MATLTISVPKPVEDWLDEQVQSGAYEDAGDLVRELIRKEQDRQAALAEFQRLIDEGFKSGISTRTREEVLAEARALAGVSPDEL